MKLCGFTAILFLCAPFAIAAPQNAHSDDDDFGPVVRAYLGYLRNEQEVVDDRVSRREVSRAYYRRNSNRIRALRQMATRIARESRNDYLPELEAVTRDELGLLFEHPPQPQDFQIGAILKGTFRYLGTVRSGELFYLFARLDPYEQADLANQRGSSSTTSVVAAPVPGTNGTRARRVTSP